MDQKILKTLEELKHSDSEQNTHSAFIKCFSAAAEVGDHEIAYMFSKIAYRYSRSETDSRAYNHAYACLMTDRLEEASEKCLKILNRNENYYQARCMLLSLANTEEDVKNLWKNDEHEDLYKLNAMDNPKYYKQNSYRYDSAVGGGSPVDYMKCGRLCFYMRKVLSNMFCSTKETTSPSYCSKLWSLNDLYKSLKSAKAGWFFTNSVPKTTFCNFSRWLTLVCPELTSCKLNPNIENGNVGVILGSLEKIHEKEIIELIEPIVKDETKVYKWGNVYNEIPGNLVYMPDNLQKSMEIIINDNIETLVFPELTKTIESFLLGHLRIVRKQVTMENTVILSTHKIDIINYGMQL